jgi:hypothetical protein
LVGQFLKFFSSETAWPNEQKRSGKHIWQVLYKIAHSKELSNPNRGSSIDAFYQAAVHLAKWFQRRRFFLN